MWYIILIQWKMGSEQKNETSKAADAAAEGDHQGKEFECCKLAGGGADERAVGGRASVHWPDAGDIFEGIKKAA